jgi:hypothetical protein
MRLGSDTSFFEILEFSSCVLISCICLCSRIFLCSLLVSCLDIWAWRLLCNFLDDTENDILVSTKTINEEARENLKISKKWVPVLRLVFVKFERFFFLFFFYFLFFFFLLALLCVHCLCVAMICMLGGCYVVCLMCLWCIQKFQWRSFKVEIEASNGYIRLRARIWSPPMNPWFHKVLKMRY